MTCPSDMATSMNPESASTGPLPVMVDVATATRLFSCSEQFLESIPVDLVPVFRPGKKRYWRTVDLVRYFESNGRGFPR